MYKIIINFFLITILCANAVAQNKVKSNQWSSNGKEVFEYPFTDSSLHIFDDIATRQNHGIIFNSNLLFGSNAITNQLAYHFYMKDSITNAMKDGVSKRLNANNRAGYINSTGISYYSAKPLIKAYKNSHWSLGISNNVWMNTHFTGDAFELPMRGNAIYAGKTANLSQSAFYYLGYNKLELTMGQKKPNRNFSYDFSIGLLQGYSMYSAYIDSMKIYTDSLGAYIDVDYNFLANVAQPPSRGIGNMLGKGASIGFKAEYLFAPYFKMNIQLTDVGIIGFNKYITTYSADSAFRFEGYKLNNLLNSTASNTNNPTDSLLGFLHPKRRSTTVNAFTPMNFNLSFTKYLVVTNSYLKFGVQKYLNSSAKSLLYISYYTQLPKFSYNFSLGYGGYGRLHVGAGCQYIFKNKFVIALQSQDLHGIILPKISGSLSTIASLGYLF